MRRLLLLPLGLALVLLAFSGKAISQPGVDPGRTTPPSPLPAGVQAASPAPVSRFPNPYPLTREAGEWLIAAAHYSCPDAPELARQVAVILRTRHKLPAYILNHADEERLRVRERFDKFRREHPDVILTRRRTVRIQEQCAVLVGGFKDFDAASAYLKVVRNLPMPELKLGDGRCPYDQVTVFQPDPQNPGQAVPRRTPINPFTTAMVVHNPTIPMPPKVVPKFDPIWTELNAGEEYSLLKCKRPWTLLIKEYSGTALIVGNPAVKSSTFLSALGFGGDNLGDRLSASAKQAHELARLLRHKQLGFQAYVLHTRTSSVVTVGAFHGPDDPDLHRTRQRIAALKFSSPAAAGDPVGLMADPVAIEIPRPGS
jgi:hypothetical protein